MSRSRSRKRAPRNKLRSRLLLLVLAIVAVAGTAGAAKVAWLVSDLPRFDAMVDYLPKEATHVYGADGSLVATFAEERRTVVPPAEIPEVLKRAILAAEDANFYQHEGLDYVGIARAFVKNVFSAKMKQGASTITQQTVKTFLLSPEKTYERKIKEMVLARRLEENLSKDEILYLYLNQIYFGHGRYGVEEAARHYFGKGVKDVTLGEAAMLAGIPQSPARLSPISHPERAKARQKYVLDRMLENGWISEAEHGREVEAPIRTAKRPADPPGAYYAEEVRRWLVERYGNEAVLTGGLRVELAMDPDLQRKAEEALRSGLVAYDRRHGWRGAIGKVTPEGRAQAEKLVADRKGSLADVQKGALVQPKAGAVLTGVVESVGPKGAKISFGGPTGSLTPEGAAWTGKKLEKILEKGELVRVEIEKVDGLKLKLLQEPEVQGALVALDPSDRRVRAMVGGWDFGKSSFNRAVQARRQPGSAFKPFVFGAALESGRWTAASLVVDAPETFRDPWSGKEWKPRNYDRDAFDGTLTLRKALALSKNTVAVRLISELGVEPVIDFARRAGVGGELPQNFTLALGTGEVTPLELANAYATLASGGTLAEPVLVEKVEDREGNVLEDASEHESKSTISPAISFVLTRLLESVVTEGTAKAAQVLARPTAGKTGTTSDGRDAWFAGYTADLVAVSWAGFDDHRPLGRSETGGKTALPAWLAFMKAAHEDKKVRDFEMPEGVELAAIDSATGLLVPEDAEPDPASLTAFVAGTAPTERALAPGVSPSDVPAELFLGDPGGLGP